MIIRKVGNDSELLNFFKSKGLSIPDLAKLLNLSEILINVVLEGAQVLTELERKRLINFYFYLHLISQEEELDWLKVV